MIKYSIPFIDDGGVTWQVQISTEDYTDEPILVRAEGRNGITFNYDVSDTDDPFSAIVYCTAEIRFYNQGQVDMSELRNSSDRTFTVDILRNGDTFIKGYVIPDGVQETFKSPPYNAVIRVTDGLALLEKMTYNHNNLPGLTSTPTRCPMNYIRQILFSPTNLGIALPVTWVNNLECTAFPGEDVFVGSVTWSARGEGFYSYQPNGETKSCLYILENILKSMQCRIFQTDGKWCIRRVSEVVTGEFIYKFIEPNLGVMSIGTAEKNALKNISKSGYRLVDDGSHVLTTKKGLKSCRVTYEANIRENILPNGNQDIQSFSLPIYWGITSEGSIESVNGIDGRQGFATQVTNDGSTGTPNTDAIFTTLSSTGSLDSGNGLPIDTYTLVQRMQFGFVFSPQNGFPFNSGTGIIDYSSNPFNIQVFYNMGAAQYYLDEFGIWRTDPNTVISIKVDGTKIGDSIRVDFNRNNAIILPKPPTQPIAGSTCDIKIYFRVRDGQRYTLDYIYITIDDNFDVYESIAGASTNTDTDERTIQISSSFGGYMLSNYMTSWDRSDTECFFKDGTFYTGTLTGMTANTIMRWLYLPSDIFNGPVSVRGSLWSFDEIYQIDGLTGKKFLPLNATYNTEQAKVNLVAIECRNDAISLTENHYGSNDETLSN